MDSVENREIVNGLKGRRCIFKEKALILLVRVLEANADDWGVKFKLDVIQTFGKEIEDLDEFEASGVWQWASVTDRIVSVSYVSWRLLHNEEDVEKVVAFAANSGKRRELHDCINSLHY